MYKVELYARVRRACMVEGVSTREAARVYGLHRDTVRKKRTDPAPNLRSLISRIFSGYGPNWGGLQTRWV